jgi:hypothetical protein
VGVIIRNQIELYSQKTKIIIPSVFLFFLSCVWAISSPIGSAADDGFHLTSIWCAWGEHKTCQNIEDGAIKLVPEKISGHPPCFVTWPWADQNGQCISQVSENLVEVSFFNRGSYPPLFYSAMRIFVGENSEKSVLMMRIFNAFLSSIMLFVAAFVSPFFIRRALFVTWGAAIIPIGIFFIPSTNPSSWTITGIGTFWAFLYSLLFNIKTRNFEKIKFAFIGTFISCLISFGSRFDSGIYLLLIFLSIIILFLSKSLIKNRQKIILKVSAMVIPIIFYFFVVNFKRYGSGFSFPLAEETTPDQPNAIVNLLMEFPSFFVGIFGGQYPDRFQYTGNLGVNFKYGVGWLEFNFPSITGITIAMSVFSLFLVGLHSAKLNRIFSILFLFTCTLLIMIFVRGLNRFMDDTYFQPRYFLPIIMVTLSIALIDETNNRKLLSTFQALTLVVLLFFGSITSWLAVFTRYAISPLNSITNLNQQVLWDPFSLGLGVGKSTLFLITSFLSIIWVFSTVFTWSRSKI